MLETFSLEKYNDALSRGLCDGLGNQDGQMCIEAAVCYAFGLPHDDDPKCVTKSVRKFKIALNDSDWSSSEARAEGLRELGLAQLGSLGVVDEQKFVEWLTLATVNKLLPVFYREVFPDNRDILNLALSCEQAVDLQAALIACRKLNEQVQSEPIGDAVLFAETLVKYAIRYSPRNAVNRINFVAEAAEAAQMETSEPDKYLNMSAKLALDVLKELGSPGCKFL